MRVTDFTMTLENSVKPRLPDATPLLGAVMVEGEITAYFTGPALGRLMRAGRAHHENLILRRVRPLMPKRMFQRLRGRMRAARRDR